MMREGVWRGALAGLYAGAVTLAAMYLAAALTGLRPLPDLVQQPLLGAMPGPVFGFLIDTLQHAGKVIEEAGLIVTMLVAMAALGGGAGFLVTRRSLPHAGLLAAAAAWAVVALVVLPLAGAGLLGLAQGLVTPLVWALVFAVYAFVWELAFRPDASAGHVDQGRREVLRLLPAGLALGGLVLVGVVKVPDWVRTIASPPESGLTGPVPPITPVANFYRVSKNFQDPVVPENTWSLSVTGQVDRALRLSRQELEGLPPANEVVTLECISNDVGGDLMSTGTFTGVPLRDLLAMAGPRPGAAALNFRARDGYTESMPLPMAMSAPEILVAHSLNGEPLPDSHGFPARLLIPGRYGMKGPKWLEAIELAGSESGGFWEQQGWDPGAPIRTTARFDAPRDGAVTRSGSVEIAGVAFAGGRGVEAVEWSADGGRTWGAAALEPALSRFSWVRWRAAWQPAAEGIYTLVVRARDGGGELQSSQTAPSFPSGANGYHRIKVTVGR